MIKKVEKKLIRRSPQENAPSSDQPLGTTILPYIPGTSEILRRKSVKNHKIRCVFQPKNTLRSIPHTSVKHRQFAILLCPMMREVSPETSPTKFSCSRHDKIINKIIMLKSIHYNVNWKVQIKLLFLLLLLLLQLISLSLYCKNNLETSGES